MRDIPTTFDLIKEKGVTEDELRKVVRESLIELFEREKSGILTEMSLKRKIYKSRVDSLIPQVLENWCLVHYCTLTGDNSTKEHWKRELRGHIITLFRFAIKGNDSVMSREHVIREIWMDNDFTEPDILNFVINNKFASEGICTTDETYFDVISDCIFSQHKLIGIILSRDINKLNEYIETI